MKRRLLLGGAVVAFGLALAWSLGLQPAGLRPGFLLVQVVGLVALVQAVRVVRARRTAIHRVTTHEPERRLSVPTPGESVEEALSTFAVGRTAPATRATRLQDGLRAATVAVLTRYEGRTEAAARDAVRTGRWTTDPFAAAFLGGPGVPAPPLAARLRAAARGRSSFDLGIDRTIDELAARSPIELGDALPAVGEAQPVRPPGVTGRGHATDGGDAGVDRWETGRWKGVGSVALAGVGAGVLAGRPAALLAGTVGIGFAAYGRSGTGQDAAVSVERRLDDDRPTPGDRVTVTVRVENVGDGFVSDLRVVDGVPPGLAVVDGSPRLGTALRAGESDEFTYEVAARRGVHRFDPALVVTHDLAGAAGRRVLDGDPDELTCLPDPVPAEVGALRRGLTRHAGRRATEVAGPGVEFHSVREYRPGDSRTRVDWKRWARTGDLSTVEFMTERAARVVLVVDARRAAYAAPGPDAEHAVERSADAAGRLFAGLLDGGDRVGLAAFSPEDCWLAPGTGATHRARGRRLLGTHPALSAVPPDRPTNLWRAGRRLRGRLEPGTGVVVLSPLVDGGATRTIRGLAAAGHPVTVLSPDPTAADRPTRRLARVARAVRLSELREDGVRVLDWRPDESLDATLARASGRWSA